VRERGKGPEKEAGTRREEESERRRRRRRKKAELKKLRKGTR
jgi:hypothetical protein